MTTEQDFTALIVTAFRKEVLRKLVFSQPRGKDASKKVTARLCAHRGQRILAVEYALSGNTVSQKNVRESELDAFLPTLIAAYRQGNLLSALGDAEYKVSVKGKETLLGGAALSRRLSGEEPAFATALASLDKKKQYLLTGDEPFLRILGISDENGRVHDKKQGKFRQINRFLEHMEQMYGELPAEGVLTVYDLCCGKSYLSFAVYHYLTVMRGREVHMLGIDLKEDVIRFCERVAAELGFSGMRFHAADITKTPADTTPDMVISLHACDVATDIVLDTAVRLGARVILSTPCCHRYLTGKIRQEALSFVTRYPHLYGKLAEVMTDAIRAARLRAAGYRVTIAELTDPDDTPKNTLIRAVRVPNIDTAGAGAEYDAILTYLLGDGKDSYLKDL